MSNILFVPAHDEPQSFCRRAGVAAYYCGKRISSSSSEEAYATDHQSFAPGIEAAGVLFRV